MSLQLKEEKAKRDAQLRTLKETLAKNLQVLEGAHGAKQREVAKAIGVKDGVYNQWRQGKVFPEGYNLVLLAAYFQTTVESLLRDGEEPAFQPAPPAQPPDPDFRPIDQRFDRLKRGLHGEAADRKRAVLRHMRIQLDLLGDLLRDAALTPTVGEELADGTFERAVSKLRKVYLAKPRDQQMAMVAYLLARAESEEAAPGAGGGASKSGSSRGTGGPRGGRR